MSLGNRLPVLAIGLVVAFTSVIIVVNAADSPDSVSKRRLQRKVERRQKTEQFRNETNREWVRSRAIGENEGERTSSFESPTVRDGSVLRSGPVAFSASAPPPSPGQDIGYTSYDAQAISSQGYNVARTPGGSRIHFAWTSFKYIPQPLEASDRFALYSGYYDIGDYPNMDDGTGYNGIEFTGSTNYGGYSGIDVDNLNHAQIAMQQAENDFTLEPYEPWHVQFPFGDDIYQVYGLEGYDNSCLGSGWGRGGVLFPRLAADRSNEVLHEIAHTNIEDCPDHKLWYWRYNPGTYSWSGPALIGSTPDISYVLAADATSDKLAVVTHESDPGSSYTNVAYIQSITNGTDWLANPTMYPTKTFITNYGPPATQSAWLHLTTTYDNSGNLHIMWDEQENANSEHIAIKHWSNNVPTPRTVALGYWDCPVSTGLYDLNLSKLTMGVGDGSTTCGGGSNNNYVYVTYTQFGGNTPAQQNDYSSEYSYEGRNGGYMNGEIYLAISNTGGNTWSPPVNLTDTKTPGCNPGLADPGTGIPANPDSVCRSEHWATIGRVVKDIDLFFISDLDAGGIPQGEGSWQLNPVHYMQIRGSGIAPAGVCPLVAPVFEATLSGDPLCEYHATRLGSTTADLTIMNLGNATLNQGGGAGIALTDFPGLPTLSITGHALGAYSIPAGDPDIYMTVNMASNNAAEGLYLGQISITHNAATLENPSPRIYPIEFFVFDEFYCPQDVLLKTGVPSFASPGSLQLKVESSGRFASQHEEGGLWRHSDSSSSFFDASLLMAHGTQGPTDTIVFLRFFDRLSNGQGGLRSQSELCVDTVSYTHGSEFRPYATAGAYMTTRDSVLGINMSWYFPQDQNADEVVIVNYLVFPGPKFTGGTISGVATGLLADLDVLPAQRHPIDTMQSGATNHGLGDNPRNLAYARGVNRPGTTPDAVNTAERFRAGIAVPSASDFNGAYIGNNADNQIGGGPNEGWLYQLLQYVSGVEVGETADTDLYMMVGFERGQSYTSSGTTWPASQAKYRSTTVRSFTAILAADTISDPSFKAKVDAAAALVNSGTFDGCAICPCRYDPACDGSATVLDVTHVVGGAFRNVVADPAILGSGGLGDDHPNQAGCNFDSRDVDANGKLDVLDVLKVIDVAFREVPVTANNSFVDPCARWKDWGQFECEAPAIPVPMEISLRKPIIASRVESADAQFVNSVVVESKTVPPGATGIQIGVYLSNDEPLVALVLPLEFREQSPGAFITSTFTCEQNPSGRVYNSPLGPALNENEPGGWPSANFTYARFDIPGPQTCSGPVSGSWTAASAQVGFTTPDAILHATISSGPTGFGYDFDLDPGIDPAGVPSYLFTFNVTGTQGTFVIDTCCTAPASHLLFVKDEGGFCDPIGITPSFTPGVITIFSPPVGCGTRSTTDHYLLACPKGDSPFEVQLLDDLGYPLVGYSGVTLNFGSCSGAELMPIAGHHPSWPIVTSSGPSDANGIVRFNVFAGGDCADCEVAVNTNCGFSAIVPVHSLDVNGDLCVDYRDHELSEGLCRDYNADGIVDGIDIGLHTAHLEDCAPTGLCGYLSIQASISPDGQIAQGDTITVDWSVNNDGNPTACDLDSIAFYHYDCEDEGTAVWVASSVVGLPIPTVGGLNGIVQYVNPDGIDFCLQVRAYGNCCATYAVRTVRVAVARQCAPTPTCFNFYMSTQAGAFGIPEPLSLLGEGWSFNVKDTTYDDGSGPVAVTQSRICVGPSPVPGDEAALRVFGAGGFIKAYRVSLSPLEGDICGLIQSCGQVPNQRVPDCHLTVLDVVCMVEYIFRNNLTVCPAENVDVNCDGFPNIVDIVIEVGTVFRNQPPPPKCE